MRTSVVDVENINSKMVDRQERSLPGRLAVETIDCRTDKLDAVS